MSIKVLLKTAVSPYSGYGVDGIGLAQALMRMGLDVYLDPMHLSPPLPTEVAKLLTKRLDAPFDLLIHHIDPFQVGITPEARRAAKVTVAWTMWEWATLDNLKGRSSLRKRLKDYDLVLGYDTVSTGALAGYTDRVATLQGGFWPGDWPEQTRDWHGDRFGFCMTGALNQRKDPFVAIQAFRELKDEYPEFDGAELHLKTNQPGLHPALEQWVPKLRVHYDVWPTDVMRQFYAAQHVMLLPSRGEGKSVPALEFQSTGGVVIATNWGGPQQWLSSQYAYPLDYTLVPESPALLNCLNARVDKDHLKHLMLHTYRNRAEVARKGALAARTIPAMCGWDAVMARLLTIVGEKVQHGQHLAAEARRGKELSRV